MKELNTLYKDLLKLQMEDEIERDIVNPAFWVGFGFLLTSGMVFISLLLI